MATPKDQHRYEPSRYGTSQLSHSSQLGHPSCAWSFSLDIKYFKNLSQPTETQDGR